MNTPEGYKIKEVKTYMIPIHHTMELYLCWTTYTALGDHAQVYRCVYIQHHADDHFHANYPVHEVTSSGLGLIRYSG